MTRAYPVERTCTERRKPVQLTFARQALQHLPHRDDAAFEAGHQGLVLRGKTEAALEGPVAILRSYYGERIDIGEASVRLHHGATLEEPYMGLGVMCAPARIEAIRADLLGRDAAIFDEEIAAEFCVIRATAPLTNLLGYRQQVSKLDPSASAILWLSHYGPVKVRSTRSPRYGAPECWPHFLPG